MDNLIRSDYYKVSGIYCLKSTINAKVYYGSTKDLYSRVNMHIRQLSRNTHTNKHLQRHYNKYGKKSLKVEVLEILPKNKALLLEREQYYLNTMLDTWNMCFNMTRRAGAPDPCVSEQTRKALKRAWKKDYERRAAIVRKNIEIARKFHKPPNPLNWVGRKHKKESKIKMSVAAKSRGPHECTFAPVIMLNDKEEPLMRFKSITDAIRFLGAPTTQGSNIGAVCRKTRKKALGFKWMYDPSKKPRELLETPEEDNQQPSFRNSM